jgi:hypothetical protein
MKSIKRATVNFGALFLILVFLCIPVRTFAIGQITQPILIKNALRGQSYDRTVTIVNTEGTVQYIKLTAEGDIGEWVKFYANSKSTESIENIEVAAKSKKFVIARFTVPQSTPNSKYTGFVSVATTPGQNESKAEESSSTVSQKIDREATVEVGGEEMIDFDVSLIPEKYDYNRGDLLKIRIIYDNRGNIDIKPQIDLKIKQGEETAYSAIFPFPERDAAVTPGSVTEISALEIPTSSLQNGKYEAIFKITQGDKILEKDFTFSVGLVRAENSVKINTETSNNLKDVLYFAGLTILVFAILFVGIKYNQKRKNK